MPTCDGTRASAIITSTPDFSLKIWKDFQFDYLKIFLFCEHRIAHDLAGGMGWQRSVRCAVVASLCLRTVELTDRADATHADFKDEEARFFRTAPLSELSADRHDHAAMPYVIAGWQDTRGMSMGPEQWAEASTHLRDVKASRRRKSRPWSSSKGLADVRPNADFEWIDKITMSNFIDAQETQQRENAPQRLAKYVSDVDALFAEWLALHRVTKRLRELGPTLLMNTTEQRKSKGFLGSNFAGTAIHYDELTNIYLQLHGSKRWILYPPEGSLAHLGLLQHDHPSAHAAHSTATIEALFATDNDDEGAGPPLCSNQNASVSGWDGTRYEVVLTPGESRL